MLTQKKNNASTKYIKNEKSMHIPYLQRNQWVIVLNVGRKCPDAASRLLPS